MKILLVQSHLGRVKYYPPVFPIGLAYIATSLPNHDVKIFDMNFWEHEESLDRLQNELEKFQPDVAGISLRNIDTTQRFDLYLHYKTIPAAAGVIKAFNSKIKLIIGGPGFSLFPQELMERIPECDYGVYMEGEETIAELVDHLNSPETIKGVYYRQDGKVHFTGERRPPDFGALPIPRRDIGVIDIKPYIEEGPHYNIGLQAKRGCALDCGYCSYPFLAGNKLRLRSAEHVVNEIEYLTGLGVDKFTFVDNVFNVPESHAEDICREIIRRGLKLDWSAWMEMKRTTEDLVRLMKQAGCTGIGFSPDGATDRALSALNKGITVADIENSIRIIRNVKGVNVGYNFFCMYPGMGLWDLLKTVYYYFKIPLMLLGKGSTFMGWVRIEPHTDLYRLALNEGYLDRNKNMLPYTERELADLFYFKKSYQWIDRCIIGFSQFMENTVKPLARILLKRGKKPAN